MKIQAVLTLILVLILSCFVNVHAQKEITSLPADFKGHDAAVLFANLNSFLKQNNASGKKNITLEKLLKGKKIYDDLTTEDYFIFTLDRGDYEWGTVSETGNYYRVVTFPLLKLNEVPSPKKKISPYGMGSGGPPPISTPLELVSDYKSDISLKNLWTSRYLPIKTVFPPEALAKNYIGYKANCYPSSYNPSINVCDGIDFTVPSPQIHYGLSFVDEQSLPLVSMKDQSISLDTYKNKNQEIAGIAAWLADYNKKNSYASPIFIVKLVPPYIQTKTFEETDSVEKKNHQAIRNIIYGDLVGVWVYEKESGKIISKKGDTLESTADDLNPIKPKEKDTYRDSPPTPPRVRLGPSRSIRIISKPRPGYTDLARKNNVMGVVHLKVTFLASGKIGDISVVKGLPHGLTDKAIDAARRVKFTPELRNGTPTTVTKVLSFNFSIY